MRNIINMIIKIAIIWGAAWLFPEYVKVQDTRTMVLVVTTILIASIILAVIMMGDIITLIGELPKPGERFKATKEGNQIEIEMPMAINEEGFGTDTLTITDVILIGTQGTAQRLLQDELTGQIYPINNVFISIINNAMIENERGEYSVTEPFFNPIRGILWKNNVCKLRAHFRTDDKNIKVLKSLKGVDITPEVPEE